MCSDEMVANRLVGTSGESSNKTRQPVGIGIVYHRPGVHTVRDLMAEVQRLINEYFGLGRSAIPPSPSSPHIGESKTSIDQVRDVLSVGCVEPAEVSQNERAQRRPVTESRGRRAESRQRLPLEFLDVRLPSRNTDHKRGEVKRGQSILPTWNPRS